MLTKTTVSLVALAVVVPPIDARRAAGDDPPRRFTVATRKADDSVGVTGDQNRTVFDLKSPSGIGRAVVERKGDDWPKVVVLRLHLTGLESLKVSSGAAMVGAAVGVRDRTVEVRQWKGGKDDTPLTEDDPLRLAVRVLDRDGKPAAALPLQGGHVEVTLPAKLFKGNPKSFALEWIDFYR